MKFVSGALHTADACLETALGVGIEFFRQRRLPLFNHDSIGGGPVNFNVISMEDCSQNGRLWNGAHIGRADPASFGPFGSSSLVMGCKISAFARAVDLSYAHPTDKPAYPDSPQWNGFAFRPLLACRRKRP